MLVLSDNYLTTNFGKWGPDSRFVLKVIIKALASMSSSSGVIQLHVKIQFHLYKIQYLHFILNESDDRYLCSHM